MTALRLVLVLGLLLGMTGPLGAADAVSTFKKAWAQAERLEDAEARVAAQRGAVQGLGAGGTEACAKILLGFAVSAELDFRVRESARAALHGIEAPEVVLWAQRGLEGEERDTTRRAELCDYIAARAASDPEAGLLLLASLDDEQWEVQVAAIRGVAQLQRKVVVDALIRLLPQASGRILGDCLRALKGLTGEKHASPEEWISWWGAVSERFSFDDPGATHDEEDTGEVRTVTRLEPPSAEPGKTIYEEIESSNVLFVVDISGSMQVRCQDTSGRSRSRLDYVKEALVATIVEQLDDGDRFNVIGFSSEVVPWKRKLVKANSKSKKKAKSWMHRTLQPEGATNIHDSLELAFKHKGVDTIYFLSDGTPTAGAVLVGDTILGKVRQWNAGRNVRVCTIGFLVGDGEAIGVAENKAGAKRFLKKLAKQNDGTFRAYE